MARMSGLELCERIVASRPDLPVVVMTAFGTLEAAIAAIRVGAYDFVTKPVEIDALVIALERAVEHRTLRCEVERLRRVVDDAQGFGELVGASAPMKRVYDLLERVVSTDATVLVTGESGTGKELVARALHRRSRRSAGPFVALNCAALPEGLLESELFGHARGAFTDARSVRAGLFQQAHGGTLFLDEVVDLPRPLQPRLLRVLPERSVRPVGADHEVAIDVRIVAATNRDLEAAVEEGRRPARRGGRPTGGHPHLPPRARGGRARRSRGAGHAGGGRAALHPARDRGGRWAPDAGSTGPRPRPQDALPQARPLCPAAADRLLASTGCRRPDRRDGQKCAANHVPARPAAGGGAGCPERPPGRAPGILHFRP